MHIPNDSSCIIVYTRVRFSVTIYSYIPDLYDLTDGKHLHNLQHLHTFGLPAKCAHVYTASSVEQLQVITQSLP